MPRARGAPAGSLLDSFRARGSRSTEASVSSEFLKNCSARWKLVDWDRAAGSLALLGTMVTDATYAAESSSEMCAALRWCWDDKSKLSALLVVSAFALRAVAGEPLEASTGASPGAGAGPSGANAGAGVNVPLGALPPNSPLLAPATACFSHVVRLASLLLRNSRLTGDDDVQPSRSRTSHADTPLPSLSWELMRGLVRTHTLQGLALALARAPQRTPALEERLAFAATAAALLEGIVSYTLADAQDSVSDSDDDEEDELYDEDGSDFDESRALDSAIRRACSKVHAEQAEEVLCAVRASAVLEHLARALLLLAAEVPRVGGGGAGEELRGKLNEAQRRYLSALDAHIASCVMLWGHTSASFRAHTDYGPAVRFLQLSHLGAQLTVAEGAGAEGSGSGSGGGSGGGSSSGSTGGGAGGEAAAGGGSTFFGLPLQRLPPAVVDSCGGCARPQCLSSKPVLRSDSVRSALKFLALTVRAEAEGQQGHVNGTEEPADRGDGAGGQGPGRASADRMAGPAARYALAMRVAGAAEAHWREYRSKLAPSGFASGSKPASDSGAGPSSSASFPPSAPQRPLTQKQLRQDKQAAARQQAAAAPKAKQGPGGGAGGAGADPFEARRADRWRLEVTPALALDALASAAPAAAALTRRKEAAAARRAGEDAGEAAAGPVPLPAEWYSAAVRALHAAMDDPRALAEALHAAGVQEVIRLALYEKERASSDRGSESESDTEESEWEEVGSEGEAEAHSAAPAPAPAADGGRPADGSGAGSAAAGSAATDTSDEDDSSDLDLDLANLVPHLAAGRRVEEGVGRAVRAGLLPCLERLLRTAVARPPAGTNPPACRPRQLVSAWVALADFDALLPALRAAPPSQGAWLVASLAKALPRLCELLLESDGSAMGPVLVPAGLLQRAAMEAALESVVLSEVEEPEAEAEVEVEAGDEAEAGVAGAQEGQGAELRRGAGAGAAGDAEPVVAAPLGPVADADAAESQPKPQPEPEPPLPPGTALRTAALVAARLLPAASRCALQLVTAPGGGVWSGAARGLGAGAAAKADPDSAVMLAASLAHAVLEWVPLLAVAGLDAARRGDCRAAAEFRALLLTDLEAPALLDLVLGAAKAGLGGWQDDPFPMAVRAVQALALVCPAELAAAPAPCYAAQNAGGRGGKAAGQGLVAALRAELAKGGAAADPEAARRLEALLARPGGAGGSMKAKEGAAVSTEQEAWKSAEVEVALKMAYWGPAASRLPPPSEAAALGPLCAHPACANLAGDSEGALPLPARCGRCGLGAYCGAECAAAHGRGSHGGVCGLGRGGDK
ncbi:hypothetical protein HYH03_016319 [Edaphochlamys debaryana]|uniref:MYND-type domain-containing protein n=1 Tax=Edaphochlamys debaryana TaxID=47281 RepID=A0A836BRS2_9CHLO|nr:hypothetical protein HYH03_016319 [Edaphochlamys debaryana]|eukprot:KAG2484933.1 hypothetical protein HYH03_016319 [Edaphochlamys debaryana]